MMFRFINDVYILFLIIAVPALSFLSTRPQDLLRLPRKTLYFSAVTSQWVLAGLTALVIATTTAGFFGFGAISWTVFIRWTVGLVGVSCAGIGVALLLESLGLWPGDSPLVLRLIPVTPGEKAWALLIVAPTAAVCEEFVYRGYLLRELAVQTHSVVFAWVVSSLAFGFCHAYQKFSGAMRAALLGALLAAPVVLAGSLYPAIATHFVIDAAGLLWLGPRSLPRVPLSAAPTEGETDAFWP